MGAKLKAVAVAVEDPELFNHDLDWFYGCFDSECGLRSAEGGIADALADGAALATRSAQMMPLCDRCGALTARAKLGLTCTRCPHTQAAQVMPVKHGSGGGGTADPYGDDQVRWSGEGTFTRGRRIRNRIVALPWLIQEDIRSMYEPRRVKPTLTLERVRAAHRAYLGLANV